MTDTKLSGWKTIIFNTLLVVFGFLETVDFTTVFEEPKAGMTMMVVGAIGAALRMITNGPVFQAPAAPKAPEAE